MKTVALPTTAQEWIDQANALLAAGDRAAGQSCLAAAASLEPDNGLIALAIGHSLMAADDLERAQVHYTEAVLLAPGLAAAHSSRALVLRLRDRVKPAQAEAECALRLDPADTVALKVLARIALDERRLGDARELAGRILELAPHDENGQAFLEECAAGAPFADVRAATPAESRIPGGEGDPNWGEEIAFWDAELSLKGQYPDTIKKGLYHPEQLFPKELSPHIAGLREKLGRVPQALDCGSGPLPFLTHGHLSGVIDLVAADPLAEVYLALLQKHGHQAPVPLVRCPGEGIVERFGSEVFDLVYIRNALDHCQDPDKVFRQMYQVLRPGGLLYVIGSVCEAINQRWVGLHQHNLFLAAEGRLMHEFRPRGGMTDALITNAMTDGLALETVMATAPSRVPGEWMRGLWRKSA